MRECQRLKIGDLGLVLLGDNNPYLRDLNSKDSWCILLKKIKHFEIIIFSKTLLLVTYITIVCLDLCGPYVT